MNEIKELCLVACSGGLDSSMTLAMLQLAGYKNIIACHFKYGHRGQHAEEIAIANVCKKLQIPVKIFDIEKLLSSIDESSMLTDPKAEITTGTAKGLKKLDAWVNCRNTQFLTWMLTFAESQVFKFNYKKVYFLGGFLNLSESGHYPDNSEYFLSSFLEHAKYGSLIGNRIEPMFCLSNLMKHELFILIKEFKLTEVYQHTISCDRPYVLLMGDPSWPVEVPANCCKDGIPACGSGLLSYWASKMVGLDDMKLRQFYEVNDKDYVAYIPEHLKKGFSKNPNIMDIINRILLPPDKIQNILKKLKEVV